MRCEKCNVDLGESYTLCPLCGEKASDCAPLLRGIETAPYPSYNKKLPCKKPLEKPAEFFERYFVPAALVMEAAYAVMALLGFLFFWTKAVPAVYTVTAALYVIFGAFDRRFPSYCIGSTIKILCICIINFIISVIIGAPLTVMAVALASAAVAVILLILFDPKTASARLKAIFMLTVNKRG